MIAPEAWLLAVVAATAAAALQPPPELLEFVAEWSVEEQRLIDQEAPAQKAPAPQGKKETNDEHANRQSENAR